jgi:hypothetical protein
MFRLKALTDLALRAALQSGYAERRRFDSPQREWCTRTENSTIAVIRKSCRQNRKLKFFSEGFWF